MPDSSVRKGAFQLGLAEETGPPPSTEATNDARRRLTDEIAGRRAARSPRKTWRWSMAGTAVAAAVAVVVAAGTFGANTPEVAPPGPEATAPELLLAAAQRAAAKPAGSGRYWRVQIVTKMSG